MEYSVKAALAALQVGEVTNWVDVVALVVLAVFFFYGFAKGFTLQLAGIVALVLSLTAATVLAPVVGEFVRTDVFESLNPKTALYLSFLVIFLVSIGLLTWIVGMLKGALDKARILPFDRFLGGILGALKAALLIMVAIMGLASLFYDKDDGADAGFIADVVRSRSADVTRWTADNVKVVLPEKLAEVFGKYASELGPAEPRTD